MFVIRKSQLDAFSKAATLEFEKRMVVHLQRLFPDATAELGKMGLRTVIRFGIQRAFRYGLEREYDVCLYLHVMLALGSRFDEDPALPWARAALEDTRRTPSGRIDGLYDRVFSPAASDAEKGEGEPITTGGVREQGPRAGG